MVLPKRKDPAIIELYPCIHHTDVEKKLKKVEKETEQSDYPVLVDTLKMLRNKMFRYIWTYTGTHVTIFRRSKYTTGD